ncbi:hypothetical protein D3C73_1255730 [compost metagenome]
MSCDQHIPFQHIPLGLHICQLQCRSDGCNRPVRIGDNADPARACADPAQSADNPEGRRSAASELAVAAGNGDFDEFRAAFFPFNLFNLYTYPRIS